MKHPLGVIEIFYGTPWAWQERLDYAAFLRQAGFDFYIYGPKADATLRKNWAHMYSQEEFARLQELQKTVTGQKLKFGIALSPYALHEKWDGETKKQLSDKVKLLSDLGIDMLGLFFDDMKGSPELAEIQSEIVSFVEKNTSAQVIFAPTYYSDDPLLDLLFGGRPDGYLESLGKNLSTKVEILWTGDKVISSEISPQHLRDVAAKLRRKPFICDNLFANDGPINCNFLKLHPVEGRPVSVFNEASGWAINPMNQAQLSKIILLGFARFVRESKDPEQSFQEAVRTLCDEETTKILLTQADAFAKKGLSDLTEPEKDLVRSTLKSNHGPFHREILSWLAGEYTVGFESLLD